MAGADQKDGEQPSDEKKREGSLAADVADAGMVGCCLLDIFAMLAVVVLPVGLLLVLR